MNRKEFGKTERDGIAFDEFAEALKRIFSSPRGEVRNENREPAREELNRKWKLVRNPARSACAFCYTIPKNFGWHVPAPHRLPT